MPYLLPYTWSSANTDRRYIRKEDKVELREWYYRLRRSRYEIVER